MCEDCVKAHYAAENRARLKRYYDEKMAAKRAEDAKMPPRLCACGCGAQVTRVGPQYRFAGYKCKIRFRTKGRSEYRQPKRVKAPSSAQQSGKSAVMVKRSNVECAPIIIPDGITVTKLEPIGLPSRWEL